MKYQEIENKSMTEFVLKAIDFLVDIWSKGGVEGGGGPRSWIMFSESVAGRV